MGEVVEEEKRLGALDENVVNAMIYEIAAGRWSELPWPWRF